MSSTETIDDVRDPNDIRPVVATGSGGRWEVWLFGALLLIGGIWLFNTLSAARETDKESAIAGSAENVPGRIASSDPLRIPDRFAGLERATPPVRPTVQLQSQPPVQLAPPPSAAPFRQLPPEPFVQPLPPPRVLPANTPPRVVFENNDTGTGAAVGVRNGNRVQAGRLARPALTIPQGTVIPAVLETALDSTRPGGARALVQRDVKGFDGTRVLIPRGSRLYGEYEAGLRPGQKRALVRWGRLIRPDGVTIQLDSPSSDPLGRAGIKGKVDSKFFQRLGGALLQSVFDIGTGIAISEATNGVVVALPGATQNVQVTDQQRILPTLKVKQGTSVSVFVARDLDFSTVEN
uniref:TrbI/VirB10 family protein n=1 Tax=uncultured Erythrobacter sp. TaxID=263913 RepID=UPI0026321FA2|nr:TrbI/VirB10 family protein [uncultured Erythrobacter sp.]